jgi:tetratricopeptide (TPR) repeat protein
VRATGHGRRRDEVPPAALDAPATALEEARERVGGCLRSGRWREALAACLETDVGLVPEVVDQVGNRAFDAGEFEALWQALSGLPSAVQSHPNVAYWLFVTATAVNRQAEVMPLVSAVLRESAAPELRAAVAVTQPGAEMAAETQRALEAHESATTIRARAFALALEGDRRSPILLFRRALALAENADAGHLVVACAVDVANHELGLGRYRSGRDWARWALDEYARRGVREEHRRELAAAALAFGQILLGELDAAREVLRTVPVDPAKVGMPTYEAVVSTVADMHVLDGRLDEALALLTTLKRRSPLTQVASASLDVTKAHIARGDLLAARESAEYAYSLSRGASRAQSAIGALGMGMALAYFDAERACELLETAARQLEQTNLQLLETQALLWLARCRLRDGRLDEASRALAEAAEGTRELAEPGWRLLMACDPVYADLHAMAHGGGQALKVRLLGAPRLEYRARELDLTLRQCEVMAVLCEREEGVTTGELRRLVFGDEVGEGTVKSTVSRLRQLVPISPSPYRITVPCECDFRLVLGLLAGGKVHQAVQHYAGPLLPGSEAPAVVELRLHIEECLRRAVMRSGDPDLLIQLATAVGDDLELWESARASLTSGDYRLPLVVARIRRVREAWR